jgi:hypothetical protein
MFLRRPGGQSQFSAQLSAQLAERDGAARRAGVDRRAPETISRWPALARRAHMTRELPRALPAGDRVTPAAYVRRSA